MGEKSAHLVREGGVIENLTVIFYAVTILLLLVFRNMKWTWANYLAPLIVLVLLFRELDFDKAFTTMGIFKSRFYKSPDVPVLEKLIAICVITLIAIVFFALVRHYGRSVMNGFFRGAKTECGIVTAFALGCFSKVVLDGLSRKFEKLGISTSEFIIQNYGILEEVLELGIPVSLLFAIRYALQNRESAVAAMNN